MLLVNVWICLIILQRVFLARFLRRWKHVKATFLKFTRLYGLLRVSQLTRRTRAFFKVWPLYAFPGFSWNIGKIKIITTIWILITRTLSIPYFLCLFIFWSSSRSNAYMSCLHEIRPVIYFDHRVLILCVVLRKSFVWEANTFPSSHVLEASASSSSLETHQEEPKTKETTSPHDGSHPDLSLQSQEVCKHKFKGSVDRSLLPSAIFLIFTRNRPWMSEDHLSTLFFIEMSKERLEKSERTPLVSWRPWAMAYSRDRPYNLSCLSAMSKNGPLRSFSSAFGVSFGEEKPLVTSNVSF